MKVVILDDDPTIKRVMLSLGATLVASDSVPTSISQVSDVDYSSHYKEPKTLHEWQKKKKGRS